LLSDGTEVVQRLRTGRPSKSELEKPLYALYQVAPSEQPQGAPRRVEVVFLSHDVVEEVHFSVKQLQTRLAKYDEAMAGILTAQFPARPNDRECPRCPHYFICPLAEDGVTTRAVASLS
ncbi:MAG: PD-(D/E)XK nuclease family protein, partial [Dehalococcoidia bacterium]